MVVQIITYISRRFETQIRFVSLSCIVRENNMFCKPISKTHIYRAQSDTKLTSDISFNSVGNPNLQKQNLRNNRSVL